MKKLIIVLISVILLLALTSCDFNSVFDEIVTDDNFDFKIGEPFSSLDEVYISVNSVTETDGVKVINLEWHNDTDGTLFYVRAYTVEYYGGGEWQDVRLTDFEYEKQEQRISPHSIAAESYSTEWFDLSREGKYRLVSQFYLHKKDGAISGEIGVEFYISAETHETLPPIEEPTVKETCETTIPDETEIADQPADGKFALEVVGAECLYEPLEQRYEPGAKVTVKIDRHIGTVGSNTGFFAVIDGKQAEIKWTDEYQYFEFIMPESNTTLYMRSYSTELIDSPYADLFVHAFWAENPHLPAVMVKRYYGENYGENKEGIPVALLDTGEEYYGDPVVEKVGDLEFRYEGLNRIWLVYDKFYTISDAYEAGILTDSDVARIYSLHNSGQEG